MSLDERGVALLDEASREFAAEVLKGLSAANKSLPCRFFYDAVGSELFEDITRTKDYYPTRTETAILRDHAADLVKESAGALLVEFGSGSSIKTELLLEQARDLCAYVPIDVSPSALAGAVRRLGERFPDLHVEPVVGDFTTQIVLPEDYANAPRIGFFPGSTLGNFAPQEAQALLRTLATTMGKGARLILGIDLRKDPKRLIAAYNDDEGVTAAFNLNLLARVNRELGGTFDLQFFRHEAVWNPGCEPRGDVPRQRTRADGGDFRTVVPVRGGRTHPHRELTQIYARQSRQACRSGGMAPGAYLFRCRSSVWRLRPDRTVRRTPRVWHVS